MTRLEKYLQELQRFGIRPGLERIRALLHRAGDPQAQYPIVLVGGTNGKGSTCEFLARLLAEDGKKTGLYTSPHLYRWNERIRILPSPPNPAARRAPGRRAGEGEKGVRELFPGAISDSELDALFEEARPYIEAVARDENLGQPTEFEVLTLLGLMYFAKQHVDIAVVEVGLGGKWDATNATEPAVSVITHVALDHCDRLGNTVEEIARDKIEIARPGRVLVTAETKPEVLRVFEERQQITNYDLRRTNFEAGLTFQDINFQTALLAQRVLYETLRWKIVHRKSSLVNRQWQVPARLEPIHQNPLVLLDGANNPDGASTLAASLGNILRERPEAKLILVLGILADKDWAAMVGVLAPLARVVIATQSHSPRAARAAVIAEAAREYCAQVETSTPVPAAVRRALELAGANDVICVTGSFYTVAEVDRAVGGNIENTHEPTKAIP
jgi:dihydrofolate synthase/folylpolyglutamate synthase